MVSCEKLFGPTYVFSSNADGMSTLKSLFKVDVPSVLEVNYARRTKQFFYMKPHLNIPKKSEARGLLV